jgi:putative transposase
MGIARSTYYDAPKRRADDTALVEAMHAIKDEFEAYGWRRMQAALGQQGRIVNHKKLKRLMRECGLNARRRRRYVATTDSDHDQPIFPNRTRDMIVDGPDQLWVADLTYVAIAMGFVHVAVIMDAWSRRIIGYAMSRRIDARLTLAALEAAIALRHPPPGCVHHTDRGSQYTAEKYRDRLGEAKLVSSMGRRGNPYDNAMMESLMKTLKVEGVVRGRSAREGLYADAGHANDR